MFDFGEELTIDSYRIPWLIWIQILVLVLLFCLLYCFSVYSSDLPPTTTSSGSSSASPSSLSNADTHLDKPNLKQYTSVTNTLQHNQAGEIQSIKGEIATSSSIRRVVNEDNKEREDPNSINYHPCNYFRLAKLAFLKCLGLSPESSSHSEQKKERKLKER